MFEIRQENVNDYNEVYNVVKEAFEKAEHSDGDEQDLVVRLRKSGSFVPELSLVAQTEDKIIGHILFTEIKIGSSAELALAPLAVLPEYQRKGVGISLIREGHRIAKSLGYNYSVVLGSPKYYSKEGYIPASKYNIKPPFDVENEFFMAVKLNENAEPVSGTVQYDKAFGI